MLDLADRLAGQQEREHLAGGRVRPVDVLDDHQDRSGPAQPGERRMHRLQQLAPVERAGGLVGVRQHPPSGHQPGDRRMRSQQVVREGRRLGRQPAEHLGERQVRERAVAEVEAVADDDLPAELHRAVAQCHEHAGLADTGVAGEQDSSVAPRVPSTGRREAGGPRQLLELGLPAEQRHPDGPVWRHACILAAAYDKTRHCCEPLATAGGLPSITRTGHCSPLTPGQTLAACRTRPRVRPGGGRGR